LRIQFHLDALREKEELLKNLEHTEDLRIKPLPFSGRRLAEHMLAEVYERLLDRYAASPQQRYEALTERCPDVLQLVPLRELASYLGVRPETLSRIRRRVR